MSNKTTIQVSGKEIILETGKMARQADGAVTVQMGETIILVAGVAAEGICGMELVEVSPPYDQSEITALMGTRVIVEVLGAMTVSGSLGKHRKHIDKPVEIKQEVFGLIVIEDFMKAIKSIPEAPDVL